MTVETQLRSFAENASAGQRPVTAEEAISRADARELLEDQPRRREWLLVAATIVLLGGLLAGLLAWARTSGDGPAPVVSITETVAPDTTVSATTAPTTAVPEASTPPVEVMVNEATLGYRDGVEWWVPGAVPGGWRYGYAVDDGGLQAIRLFADRSAIDVEFGADAATIGDVAVDATTEELGGESWWVADSDGVGVAARVIDGRLLAVRGPIDPVRHVAAELELVPETELVRPPFRADAGPGPVVLTLPPDQIGGNEPFELRAHTDGLFTSVGGEIKQVSPEDPLAFGDAVYELTGDAESYRVVLTGVALDEVEQITFGLQDGDAVDVTTTDSDRFAERFYAFVIDVPASILEAYDEGGLEQLTRWTLTYVDGEQRVYDEPGSESCINCDELPAGPDDIDVIGGTPPATPSDDATPLEFTPTNMYGDGLWLIPAEVPDGLEFDHARRFSGDPDWVEQVLVYVHASQELESGVTVVTYAHPDGSAATLEPVAQAKPVEIGGETWWLEEFPGAAAGSDPSGRLSGVVDGREVVVSGDRSAALAAAGSLELVPESQLPRPPFDRSTSVLVARSSGVTLPAELPTDMTELRAATDGASISLAGGTPTRVTSDQPVGFNGISCPAPAPGARTNVCHVAGYTVRDVATLEFEQLDGEVITIVPEDLSGKFGIRFFLAAIEIPAEGLMVYASVVPSVIARDANGGVLATLSEPI